MPKHTIKERVKGFMQRRRALKEEQEARDVAQRGARAFFKGRKMSAARRDLLESKVGLHPRRVKKP